MTGDLRVQCITRIEDVLALKSDWLDLEIRAGVDVPFQTWEWTIAWWNHLREDSRAMRDNLRVCVVRDQDQRAVAIAPLILTERPSVGPLRVRYLHFVGADPNITEIRGMLCTPGFEGQVFAALREYFGAALDWDWSTWEGLAADTHVSPAHGCSSAESTASYVLPLAADWASMKAGLGRNIKESIRRCYNSLRRDGLSCRMDTLERSDAVADGLAEFLRLHTRRAQRSDLPVHADVFASEQARGFLTEVCTRLAERGVARIFRLWVDDRVVAIRVGFQMQHHLYLYYSGWDADYAQYSVMTTLLCEIIKDAIEHRIGAINLSTGKDVSKTRWGPSEVTYPAMLELSPSLSSRARYHAFQLIRSIGTRPTVRQMLPASFVRRSPRDLVENSDLRAGPRARGGNWLSIATPRSRFVGELPQSRQSAT